MAHEKTSAPRPAAENPQQLRGRRRIRAGAGRHAVPAAAIRARRRGGGRLHDLLDRLPLAVVPGTGRGLPAVHGRLDRPARPLRRPRPGAGEEPGGNSKSHAGQPHDRAEQAVDDGTVPDDGRQARRETVAEKPDAVSRRTRLHQRRIVCRRQRGQGGARRAGEPARAGRYGAGRCIRRRERRVVCLVPGWLARIEVRKKPWTTYRSYRSARVPTSLSSYMRAWHAPGARSTWRPHAPGHAPHNPYRTGMSPLSPPAARPGPPGRMPRHKPFAEPADRLVLHCGRRRCRAPFSQRPCTRRSVVRRAGRRRYLQGTFRRNLGRIQAGAASDDDWLIMGKNFR
ncbi:unnamed protein product [Rhizophagus irregularis]|nr:unnamed protein product [Rhizophagus irregularis]